MLNLNSNSDIGFYCILFRETRDINQLDPNTNLPHLFVIIMSEKKEKDDLLPAGRRSRKMTGTGPDGPVRMKKEVGPMAATMIILGAIIGSGIYVSPTGNYISII